MAARTRSRPRSGACGTSRERRGAVARRNAAESAREQFQLRWGDAVVDAYIPIGQSRIVRPPKPPADRAQPLTLTGDDVDFDNRLFLLAPQPVALPVLFAGPDADDDPHASLYYLRRAFPKTRRQHVEITVHRGTDTIPAFQLAQAQLLVLGEGISDNVLASAREFARAGRTIVFPLTSAAGGQTLARLLEVPAVAATEAAVKDYALLAQIEFKDPLFASFADPRFSDFTKIHFWKYRRLDPATLPAARVLARFDGGDPAIAQVPLGKGSVVIFASSWRPADSQLALSSKFVPLLNAILEQSSNMPLPKAQYFVGDEVPLPPAAQPFTIRKPDGSEAQATGKFTAADQPGIYSITSDGGRSSRDAGAGGGGATSGVAGAPPSKNVQRFVVNLAPDESRLTPLTSDRFVTLGVPVRKTPRTAPAEAARREAQAQAAELEGRQKLWRWLLLAALVVLLLETRIAGKLSRPNRTSTTAPA